MAAGERTKLKVGDYVRPIVPPSLHVGDHTRRIIEQVPPNDSERRLGAPFFRLDTGEVFHETALRMTDPPN